MAAGPIGSCWASGSWSNTAWEANTWADAVVPVVAENVFGVSRHTPPRQIRPQTIRLQALVDLPALDLRAELVVLPGETVARIRALETFTPMAVADVTATPAVTKADVAVEIAALDLLGTFSLDATRTRKRSRES